MKAKPRISVRWMCARDLDAVVMIDAQGSRPWLRKRLLEAARYDGRVVLVAETAVGGVCGFLVYSFGVGKKKGMRAALLRLVVSAAVRRTGVGRTLLGDFESRMGTLDPRPARVTCEVADDDLDAHLFLRACGWTSVKVVPEKSAYKFAKSLEVALTGA